MISKKFFAALEDFEREKGIDREVFLSSLEAALTAACKKSYGEASNVEVKIFPEKSTIRAYISKTVVETVEFPEKEITLEDAQKIKKSYKIGDTALSEIFPEDFSRIAAQSARQVIMNSLHQAEKSIAFNQFAEKENKLVIGIISRVKPDGTIFVEIGKNQMEGTLPVTEQIPGERFRIGDRIKVLVKRVREGNNGAQITLSRASSIFVKRLLENEVPEIRSEIIQIKSIVREAGFRTKLAVYSTDPDIDAVGACVGNKGVRINSLVTEMNGEKIDVIPWSSDNLDYIARALSPAKVLIVQADEELKEAKVVVPDEKLSLAIGKEGQNARLAAKLTGWKIDVKSYTAAMKSGMFDSSDDEQYEEEANG